MKIVFYGFTFIILMACSQPVKQPTINSLPKTNSASATSQPDSANSIQGYFQSLGDSIVLPSFSIQLKLSPQAEEKLKALKETVVISVTFQGIPKDTTERFFQQWGYIVTGNNQIELKEARIATFNRVKISKGAYDSLASKDVDVLINVFSGRHASQNNLLDCESLQEPISKVRRQTNVLRGKLIGE